MHAEITEKKQCPSAEHVELVLSEITINITSVQPVCVSCAILHLNLHLMAQISNMYIKKSATHDSVNCQLRYTYVYAYLI